VHTPQTRGPDTPKDAPARSVHGTRLSAPPVNVSEGQHDDLLFATCLGVWAWERAIEKQEYRSFPGEYIAELPINVIGKRR
jgi:hypothetical protein